MFGYTVVVDKTAEEGVPGACIGRIGQTSEIQFESANECAVEIELRRSFRAPYLPHPSPPCQVRGQDCRRHRPDRHAVPRDRGRAAAPEEPEGRRLVERGGQRLRALSRPRGRLHSCVVIHVPLGLAVPLPRVLPPLGDAAAGFCTHSTV